MKKVTLLFCLSAGALLTASIALNLYLLSGRRSASSASSVRHEIPGQEHKKSAAKPQSKPLYWERAEYDRYDKLLRIEFKNAGRLNLNPQNIRVTPAVPFTLESLSGGTLLLRGGFQPETQYSFHIPKGISDETGKNLAYDAAFKVRIPSLPPSIRFLTSGPYFPKKRKNTTLPAALVNVSAIRVHLKQVYSNNLVLVPADSWRGDEFTKKIREVRWNVELPRNKEVNCSFDFAPLIENLKPGIYRIEMESGNGEQYVSQSTTLVLTDLSLQAVTDPIGGRAFGVVRRLEDNAPVAGASVELRSRKNQKIGSGVTNAEGIADLRHLPEFQDEEDEAALMLASYQGDTTYCTLSEQSHSLVSQESDSASHFSKYPRAFVYFERGVCRPGESVRASSFLRSPDLTPVKNTPAILTLFDPMGRSIAHQSVKTDAFGFFRADFRIPENGRTGAYTVRVSFNGRQILGSADILAANFIPDRIKVQLTPDSSDVPAGKKSSFRIRADYYFGNDLGKAPASVRVFPGKPHFPNHWQPYTVGDPKSFSAGRLFSRTLMLENGTGSFDYPGFAAQNGSASMPFLLHAEAGVSEPGGRTVTARSALLCHPAETYLGLLHREPKVKLDSQTAELHWKLLAAHPASEVKAQGTFHWELKRKEWNPVLRRDSSGNWKRIWTQEEIPVSKGTLTPKATEGTLILKHLPDGNYEILAEDGTGRRTRLEFWHFAGEGGRRSGDPSRLVFKTDRAQYRAGETAAVTFRSPGSGTAFAATGGGELASMLSFPVKPGENTIAIPLPRDLKTSSCFSGITLVTGETRCFGLLKLNINQDQRRAEILLKTVEKAHPRETITVETKLLDADGRGRAGILQLFAVDEGILALTDYKTPDPFSFFFGDYYCPYRFADLFDGVYPDLKIGADGRIGGDAAKSPPAGLRRSAPELKQQTSAVVLLDTVRDDGQGCRTQIRMPDHVGAMRIMAVAATEDQAGSASATVILRKPVTVLISSPGTVASGDEFDITFTVFPQEWDRNPIPLSIRLPEFLTTKDPLFYSLNLKNGESGMVRLRVKAKQGTGNGSIHASIPKLESKKSSGNVAASPTATETAEQTSQAIRLRDTTMEITKTERFLLRPGERKKIPAGQSFAGIPSVEFTVSGTRAPGLGEALAFLNRYPYGCLEQRTAAAFPLLCADALKNAGNLKEAEAQSIDVKAERAAAELLALMRYDGSFGMWPGSAESWDDGSVFASHFLLEAARKQLVELSPELRKKICSNLLRIAETASNPRGQRAYACYALALGNHPSALKTARNLLADRKDDYASLLAAAALIRGNHAGEGAEHLERILKREVWRENGAPYEPAGPACRYGMTLALLAEFRPDAPETLLLAEELKKLLKQDGSAWGTTQDNAWAVYGLAQAAAASGGVESVQGQLLLPSAALPISTSSEQSFRPAGNPAAEIVNTGNAPMLVRIQRKGIPRVSPKDTGTLKLTKTYRNEAGEEIRKIRQGELVRVCLTLESPGELNHLVISDRLPGGLEIEDPLLATRSAALSADQRNSYGNLRVNYVEKGDGEFLLFGDLLRKGNITFTYTARAVTRGTYRVPPVHAEGMYAPETQGTHTPDSVFEIQ